jgi:uncharacterized protein
MARSLFFVVILVLGASTAPAAEVEGLYNAQAVVTGTVEPERTRGFRAGLTDAVVELTGDPWLADGKRIAPLLEDPHRFVAHFEYEDRMKDIPVHDEQGTRERPHDLRMRFKADAIDAALASLGLTRWPAHRPMLAVWLGVRTALSPYVLRADGPNGYGQRLVIRETAIRRGLPVRLPPAEEAIPAVTVDDIAAEKAAKLWRRSGDAGALLSGVLSITADGYWDISWRLDWHDRVRTWALHRVSFDTALKDGIDTAVLVLSGNVPL